MIASSRKLLGFASWVAVLTLALGAHGRADSVAVTITPDPGNTMNLGFGFSLGYEFMANSNITVTQLGYFVDTTLTESHDVGIYDVTTMTLLASTTVMNGDTQIANFVYNAIAPLALTAGQDYVIVGTSGLVDPYTFTPNSFSVDPSITFIQSAFNGASGTQLQYPDVFDPTVTGYFGPNFLFTAAVVPEPSSLALSSLAAVAGLLGALRRRFSRMA